MRYVILIVLLLCLPVRGEAWQVVGGGGVAPLGFDKEVHRQYFEPTTHSTKTITLATSIDAGTTAVLIHGSSGALTLSSIADSAGNTWTIDVSATVDGLSSNIASSTLASSLPSGGTITLTYAASGYFQEWVTITSLTGAKTGVGVYGNVASAYTTSPNISATTTSAPSLEIGLVSHRASTYTPGWTAIGEPFAFTGSTYKYTYVYNASSVAGSKNPGGTVDPVSTVGGLWISYY